MTRAILQCYQPSRWGIRMVDAWVSRCWGGLQGPTTCPGDRARSWGRSGITPGGGRIVFYTLEKYFSGDDGDPMILA